MEGAEWIEKMPGAPKGNKNALKHGLYASAQRPTVIEGAVVEEVEAGAGGMRQMKLRGPEAAIRYLEDVMDQIYARMKGAKGEEFTRLANALSLAATSLFAGHRTVAFLTGGVTPVEEALRELEALDFEED